MKTFSAFLYSRSFLREHDWQLIYEKAFWSRRVCVAFKFLVCVFFPWIGSHFVGVRLWRALLRKNRPVILDQKLIFLIFWDIKVTKMHFVWPKMRNIIFYEFLNFRSVGIDAIWPLKLQKSPTLPALQKTRNSFKKPDFLFKTCIRIHHSRCPSHITVPNYLFILTARIFLLTRVISVPSKHKNSSTLGGV